MFEKLKDNKGFVLLESLISLSLISLAVIILIPMIAHFQYLNYEKKVQVEEFRDLYDYAVMWQGNDFNYQVNEKTTLTLEGVQHEEILP